MNLNSPRRLDLTRQMQVSLCTRLEITRLRFSNPNLFHFPAPKPSRLILKLDESQVSNLIHPNSVHMVSHRDRGTTLGAPETSSQLPSTQLTTEVIKQQLLEKQPLLQLRQKRQKRVLRMSIIQHLGSFSWLGCSKLQRKRPIREELVLPSFLLERVGEGFGLERSCKNHNQNCNSNNPEQRLFIPVKSNFIRLWCRLSWND